MRCTCISLTMCWYSCPEIVDIGFIVEVNAAQSEVKTLVIKLLVTWFLSDGDLIDVVREPHATKTSPTRVLFLSRGKGYVPKAARQLLVPGVTRNATISVLNALLDRVLQQTQGRRRRSGCYGFNRCHRKFCR